MACVTSFESHFAALCIELINSGNEDFISKILPLFNGTLINSNPESVDKGRTNIVLLLYSKMQNCNPKKPKKTSPKFEICGSVRFFFRYFSAFFGFFRFFSVFFGFLWYFLGFFRSELRQEIPVIQKSCQQ